MKKTASLLALCDHLLQISLPTTKYNLGTIWPLFRFANDLQSTGGTEWSPAVHHYVCAKKGPRLDFHGGQRSSHTGGTEEVRWQRHRLTAALWSACHIYIYINDRFRVPVNVKQEEAISSSVHGAVCRVHRGVRMRLAREIKREIMVKECETRTAFTRTLASLLWFFIPVLRNMDVRIL